MLVEFLRQDDGGDDKNEVLKDIEGLPFEWLVSETKNGKEKYLAYYPSPPYTIESCKRIQEMIKIREPHDPFLWSLYEVSVKGQASKFLIIIYRISFLIGL